MSDVMNKICASIALIALNAGDRLRREDGQATTEYVVILAAIVLIAAAAIGTTTTGFGLKIINKIGGISL